jgi:signal transduction histidine kinase
MTTMDAYMGYLTAFIYWLLVLCWGWITLFYCREYRRMKSLSPLFLTLLIVLFIDAARTLLESTYFGVWYTARTHLLPYRWFDLLSQPQLVIIPKTLNLFAAFLIIVLVQRRWFPNIATEIARQREVEKLQEFQEGIFNAITDPVTVHDAHYRIITANAAANRLLGREEQPLAGAICYQAFHGREEPCEVCPVAETWQTGQPAMAEMESEVMGEILQSWTYPLRDSQGAVQAVIKYAKIVTEEKQLQAQQQEVANLKAQLASIASHELRTPLTSIQGYAALLLDDTQPLEPALQRECLEVIHNEAQRLNALVTDILDMSAIEAGRFEIHRSLVSVCELCQRAIDRLSHPQLQHQIQLECDPDLPRVLADPDKTLQVLTNLLSNATKYSPPGSTVTVRACRRNGAVEVTVADQGTGMSEEEMHNLFQPFYRTPSARASGISGTGLGLYISRSIITAQEGEIWAESEVGKGSVFHFTLPIAEAS